MARVDTMKYEERIEIKKLDGDTKTSAIDKTSGFEVVLDWEQCEILSKYYRFPTVVFLFSKDKMKKYLRGIRKRIKKSE